MLYITRSLVQCQYEVTDDLSALIALQCSFPAAVQETKKGTDLVFEYKIKIE